MSNDSKKYYWLKLNKDFFKRHDIKIVEAMPNGKDYILFYLKLLCESTTHSGELRFSETIPYNEEMLATITSTNVDIVRQAIKIFRELEMIELFDDGTLYMAEVSKMIGSETGQTIRKKEAKKLKDSSLDAQKLLTGKIEEPLDAQPKKEKESKRTYGAYKHVRLTDGEKANLDLDLGEYSDKCITYLDEYLEMTGKSYKSHYMAIRKWVLRAVKEDETRNKRVNKTNNPFVNMLREENG